MASGSRVFHVKDQKGFKAIVDANRASPRYHAGVPGAHLALSADSLPSNFDARNQWPGCVHPVLDQGDCGSCWAFAATESLSDRFCIASKYQSNATKVVNVVLSPQDLLSCEDENWGCAMGSPPDLAWRHLTNYGVKSLDCIPYVNGDGGSVPACTSPNQCSNTSCSNSQTYFAASYYHVGDFVDPSNHILAIMKEIYTNGPVDATFNVWSDFDDYAGGVYINKGGSYEGLHSIKVIGWGVESANSPQPNVPYWLIQNSWGNWGPYNGYFKIIRGQDECLIESAMYAGLPKLE